LVIVKSITFRNSLKKSQLEKEIDDLINLWHSYIADLIGLVLSIESISPPKLKIFRLYFDGCSLAEILSVNSVWRKLIVKMKAVVEIVPGLRFAHSLDCRTVI
jgi:hypothetical protein